MAKCAERGVHGEVCMAKCVHGEACNYTASMSMVRFAWQGVYMARCVQGKVCTWRDVRMAIRMSRCVHGQPTSAQKAIGHIGNAGNSLKLSWL